MPNKSNVLPFTPKQEEPDEYLLAADALRALG